MAGSSRLPTIRSGPAPPERRGSSSSRALTLRRWSWVALSLGGVLLYWLLQRPSASRIWEDIALIGWRSLLLLPLALFWILPNTQAWSCAFLSSTESVPFRKLFLARVIGDSVNDLIPGYVAGEPLKAGLLAPRIALGDAMSSVVLSKTTQNIALLIFLSGGLGLIAWRTRLPTEIRSTAWAVTLLLFTAVVVLTAGSSSGLLGKWARRLQAGRPHIRWQGAALAQVVEMDVSLRAFYRDHKRQFVASTSWHLLGYVAGALELYAALCLWGFSPKGLDVLVLDVVVTLATTGAFFIPAGLGAFEFGHYVGASMIGVPPSIGISVALVRRFRQLFWSSLGLALLSFQYRGRTSTRFVDEPLHGPSPTPNERS